MSIPRSVGCRLAAAVAAGFMGLALAGTASAVDLRDWGRKFPASERFIVLSQFNNQAVLDKETQLVWQRTPSSFATTGAAAKNSCIEFVLGGRRGWRLPSVHELMSLARPDSPIGVLAIPAGHPFKNVPIARYWTSTRPILNSGELSFTAYVVSFIEAGQMFFSPVESGQQYFWCVRGGGPLSLY